MDNIFKNKKFIPKKLIDYGFKKSGKIYSYSEPIMDGEFLVKIEISDSGIVKTQIVETETNELYTLHLTDSDGAFVGKIRDEYNKVLTNIVQNCFENCIFKFDYSYKVINYIKEKFGDDMEYLWEKTPDNAIARRKDNKKWYLVLLTVRKNRFGFDDENFVEVLNLRVLPDDLPEIIKQNNIYPAYHMNKKHWISIILDGSVEIKEIYRYIDQSYILAKGK